MTTPLLAASYLTGFSCLADRCDDTCCKGWGMQVDPPTLERYRHEAPELLPAVTEGEAEHVMRRDPATDYCVKFEHGLCGIHARYGTQFLGDACHFFPRIPRLAGERHLMAASLSCPEIARLGLLGEAAIGYGEASVDRLPATLVDRLPAELEADSGLALHSHFLSAMQDASLTPERHLLRLAIVARSLTSVKPERWPAAVPFYLANADSRLPPAEENPADPFLLLQMLCGLVGAAKPVARPRLEKTIADISDALAMAFDEAGQPQTSERSLDAWHRAGDLYDTHRAALAPTLRRYLAMQMTMTTFPFAGIGDTPFERAILLAMRFAITRLALIALLVRDQALPSEADIVRVVQSLSRFIDHLADPTLWLKICEEIGWNREARLCGLLECFDSDLPKF